MHLLLLLLLLVLMLMPHQCAAGRCPATEPHTALPLLAAMLLPCRQ
jgi:hypothetical protein